MPVLLIYPIVQVRKWLTISARSEGKPAGFKYRSRGCYRLVRSCSYAEYGRATMWWTTRRELRERHALAATPNHGIELSGHWHALERLGEREISWGIRLEQFGVAISGTMVGKFATPPTYIRGLVVDDEFVANYWLPGPEHFASGVLRLRIEAGARSMVGTGSWFALGRDANEVRTFRWER